LLAVRYYGIGDVRVENIAKPVCGPGEVLIKVAYAGICGSDLHIFRKGMFVTYTPETMGHEFVGTVEAVGEGVTAFKPHDHVVGDPRVGCGTCEWCRQGAFNLCPSLGFIGEVSQGCFAEYIVMDARKLFLVPPEVELRRAALVEPLAVALHILTLGGVSETDSLGIVGAGPIGLLTVVAAKAVPVKQVTVIDISSTRLELARKLGADNVLPAFPDDPTDGVDAVVEAVGIEATLTGALKWLKPQGRLVMAGLYEEKVHLDPNDIVAKEMKLVGVNAYETADMKRAVDFLACSSAALEQVISHVLPLSSAPEGFYLLTSPGPKAAKILLAP